MVRRLTWWRGRLRCGFSGFAIVAVGCLAQSADAQGPATVQNHEMTFFVTSSGRGFGGDLAGVSGADFLCAKLATESGHGGDHLWRAYLSAPGVNGRPPVHARDRIGNGPWYNARGELIAESLADLHRDDNPRLRRQTLLTEKGTEVGPNRHDIMTGSNPDGTLATDGEDTTCRGWTSHNVGAAMVGHTNGFGGGLRGSSWNSAHLSRGCSQDALRASNGAALIYCFAAD